MLLQVLFCDVGFGFLGGWVDVIFSFKYTSATIPENFGSKQRTEAQDNLD